MSFDYDDAADSALFGSVIFSNPIISFIFVVLSIIFAVKACDQRHDCEERSCSTGQPKLVKGDCLCVERAK